jgi:peptidyl-prolyl cis-trans isomerase SurA
MNRLVIFVFLLSALPMVAQSAQGIDRVVAVVNKHVITQSDWEDQSNFEALVEGRAVDSKPSSASLDRLVERALISDAISAAYLPKLDSAQIDAQLQDIRKQSDAADDAGWKKLLAAYSLSEGDLREKLAEQLSTAQLFEMRFRSTIRVNDEEIRDYYQKSFLPELLSSGAKESAVPKLEDVSARIQRILSEQKLTEAVVSWMETLRSQAKIKQIRAEAK